MAEIPLADGEDLISLSGFTPEFIDDIERIFALYVSTEALTEVMSSVLYEAVAASLSGATRAEVLDAVQEHAARLVTRMTKDMQKQLAEKVAEGLEKQLGPERTARLIRDGLGLDSNREKSLAKYRRELEARGVTGDRLEKLVEKEKQALIKDRARTIASHEMGRAMETAEYERAKANGATHKVWLSRGIFDDVCLQNEAQGPIPIEDKFASGHTQTPAHVNCKCTMGYITDRGTGQVDRAKEASDQRVKDHEALRANLEANENAKAEAAKK